MNRFLSPGMIILTAIVGTPLLATDFTDNSIINDQQLNTFAKQIEASIENRDPLYFNLSFNYEYLAGEIIQHSRSSKDSTFNKGFTDGIKSSFDLGSILINELGSAGSFAFIHAIWRDSSQWLLYRLISENGINYHEYQVQSNGENYFLTDGYFYLSGDLLSESLRELYNKYTAMLQNYSEEDIAWMNAMNDLQKAKELNSDGKPLKAIKCLDRLPENYCGNKKIQCARINIALSLGSEKYLPEFNKFMKNYPDEPGKYLMPLDGLITNGYFAIARLCLDSLDHALHTDPLLDFFRANISYETGRVAEAVNYLEILINKIPDFEVAYMSLLTIYLAENKFEEATGLLNRIIVTFNAYKEDIYPYLAGYPEYLNSALYQEWINQ